MFSSLLLQQPREKHAVFVQYARGTFKAFSINMSFPITAHHRGKSYKQAFMAIIDVSVHFAVSGKAPQAACSGSRLLSGDCDRAVAGSSSALAMPRLLLTRQVPTHHHQSCIPLARAGLPHTPLNPASPTPKGEPTPPQR